MNLRDISRRAVTAASAACLAAGTLFLIPETTAGAAMPSASAAPAQGALFGVSATSATDAWAVGYRFGGQADRTLTLHWNGRSWRRVKSLSPGGVGQQARLLGVSALSATNVWAVGFFSDGSLDHSLIEHWNGRAWKQFTAPAQGCMPGDGLSSVTAISSSNVWAVGPVTNCFSLEATPDAFHWNGRAWHEVPPPNPGNLLGGDLGGVDATSAHDVWAVGYYPDGSTPLAVASLTAHWNGTKWKLVASPNPVGADRPDFLQGVSATSRSNAWAVGSSVPKFPDAPVTVAVHWNGHAWKRVPSPHPAHGNGDELLAVDALSAREAFAVGDFRDARSRSRNLVIRWNGRSWSLVPCPTPPAPAKESGLTGVTATSAKNAWSVGFYVVGTTEKAIILHWNGKSWHRQLYRGPGCQ